MELFSDNTFGSVVTATTVGATTVKVNGTNGTFPSPGTGQQFHVVINAGTNGVPLATTEVATVTANSSGTFTCSALTFKHSVGEVVAMVVAAGGLQTVQRATPAFRSLTTPPVSTTSYQNTTGKWLTVSVLVTLTPTSTAVATVVVALSPTGSSFTTWSTTSLPAGATTSAGAKDTVTFPVPPGWHYKLTATHSTLGVLKALG